MEGHVSEVARLRRRIQEEYEAGQRALYAMCAGNARYDFITKRTENIGRIHSQLISLVGEPEAARIVVQTLNNIPESGQVPV